MAEYTETVEEPEAPETPEQEGAPSYHSLLQVWRTVLDGAYTPANRRITAKWATNIVTRYPGIGFADLQAHSDRYFEIIEECIRILDEEIASDEDCYKVDSEESDRENNSIHYLNLLRDWQLVFLDSELRWDSSSPTAATDLSALNEAHGVFFGPTGLVQHLDNIQFEFTEDDQADLATALQELEQSYAEAEGE